jgi:transcription factor C subunit 6
VINKERRDKASKKKKGKKAKKAKLAEFIEVGDSGADDAPLEEISAHMASRMVIHEPLTRVAAVAWNPNVDFGTWTAVAFGSGLVRVMDVGVE